MFSKLFGGTKGTPPSTKKISALGDTGKELFDLIHQGVLGQGPFASIFGGFDPEQINQFFQTGVADPMRKQFQERTLPGLAQRTVGAGLSRSSGLQRQIGQQENDLEDRLMAMLAQQQMGARESALQRQRGGIENLLKTPETIIQQTPGTSGTPGMLEQFLPQALGMAGSAIGGPVFGAAGSWLSNKMFER